MEHLRQRFGAREITYLKLNLPENIFKRGTPKLLLKSDQALLRSLKDQLEMVKKLGGGLLIVGDGSDASTEEARKLLANARAIAFASWLANNGIGDKSSLLRIIAENGGYESIFFVADNGSYESIFY